MQTLSLLGPVDICFSHGSFCGFKRGHLDLEVKKIYSNYNYVQYITK